MNAFKVGETVVCVKDKVFNYSDNRPPLEINEEYQIKRIILDKRGNQHLDVGIPSKFNYITSKETFEELPNGDSIHWCHPSRFQTVQN